MVLPVMLCAKAKNESEDNKRDRSLFFRGKNEDAELGAKIHWA
jgi:hypothetical protein